MFDNKGIVNYVREGLMALFDGVESINSTILVKSTSVGEGTLTYVVRYSIDGESPTTEDTFYHRKTILDELRRYNLIPKSMRPEITPPSGEGQHWIVRFCHYPTPRKQDTGEKQLLECLGHYVATRGDAQINFKWTVLVNLDDDPATAVIENISELKWKPADEDKYRFNFTYPKGKGDVSVSTMRPIKDIINGNPFSDLFDILDPSRPGAKEIAHKHTLTIISEAYGTKVINFNPSVYFTGLSYL